MDPDKGDYFSEFHVPDEYEYESDDDTGGFMQPVPSELHDLPHIEDHPIQTLSKGAREDLLNNWGHLPYWVGRHNEPDCPPGLICGSFETEKSYGHVVAVREWDDGGDETYVPEAFAFVVIGDK